MIVKDCARAVGDLVSNFAEKAPSAHMSSAFNVG
jgi:hypothetical protein